MEFTDEVVPHFTFSLFLSLFGNFPEETGKSHKNVAHFSPSPARIKGIPFLLNTALSTFWFIQRLF
jgi:hypothetical protein